jgi:hypothetical protein
LICGISALTFFLFLFGIINPYPSVLIDFFQKFTDYFIVFSFNNLDYLALSLIPVFGMLFNSKRNRFKTSELISDILIIALCVLIIFMIGLYMLPIIGKKPSNPLIPQYFINQPFILYSTITIGIGIAIPFLFIKRTEKPTEIDNIGNCN